MARIQEQVLYTSALELGALHADVISECTKSAMEGSPWTRIRPLQKGVDASDTLSCDGAIGDRDGDCPEKVEAVQYSSMQGESQHYCEKHALKQNEWDIVHYYSEQKKIPDLTKDQEAFIAKLLIKKKKLKPAQEVPEETDLMD